MNCLRKTKKVCGAGHTSSCAAWTTIWSWRSKFVF